MRCRTQRFEMTKTFFTFVFLPFAAKNVWRAVRLRDVDSLVSNLGAVCVWVVNVRAAVALPPGKRAGTILQESGWAPGPVWTGVEKRKCLASAWVRTRTLRPAASRLDPQPRAGKGKAFPNKSWRPRGNGMLSFHPYFDIRHNQDCRVVSCTRRPLFTFKDIFWC